MEVNENILKFAFWNSIIQLKRISTTHYHDFEVFKKPNDFI